MKVQKRKPSFGFLGKHHTEEAKRKISLASIGRKPALGKHWKQSAETILKKKLSILGKNHWNWQGGFLIHNGYKYILTRDKNNKRKYIREHRLIAEKHLERPLEKYEIIHHINGDKLDNSLENLYLFFNNKEHNIFHHNPYKLLSNIC